MCVDVIDKDSSKDQSGGKAATTRVGVAGLGLIGEGAALRLISDALYEFCGAFVRDPSRPRDAMPAGTVITDDINEFLATQPDIVIDALPVADAGRAVIEQALARGISVVSANKQAVAGALTEFSSAAEQNEATLSYSASVGGGAPMVETVREARAHGDIVEMTAILNGTVNFILTALSEGVSFDDAVREAQDAGFAEPDPTADLSGDDARAKISILCFDAFDAEVDMDAITTVALDKALADKIVADGGAYKQLSLIKRAESGAVSASLSFVKVADDDFFAGVKAEGNALRVVTADGREFVCADKGAGRTPTVASLFADLEIIRAGLPPRPSS